MTTYFVPFFTVMASLTALFTSHKHAAKKHHTGGGTHSNPTIPLITFDGNPATTHHWSTLNDPVMGGKSTSNFTISSDDNGGLGIFDGEVVDVPFLHAPGFVQAYTDFHLTLSDLNIIHHDAEHRSWQRGEHGDHVWHGKGGHHHHDHAFFPDIRGCSALEVSASLPGGESYDGFKISFGTSRNKKFHCGRHSYGYKAALPMKGGVTSLQKVTIPLEEFSDCNDDATGLPLVTCAEDEEVCPDEETLSDIKTIAIWGEGTNGKFHLEISSIEATGCTVTNKTPENPPVTLEGDIILATFDGSDESTNRTWQEMNDPVMGGESTGNFTVVDGMGHFVGEVVDVPFLAAPGFIKVGTTDLFRPFPDVSLCDGIKIEVKAGTEYEGYRFSFGVAHPPEGKMFAYGYKADFHPIVSEDEFEKILIPFDSFTDYWDDATGDAIVTCQENKKFCPGKGVLRNLKTIAFWGEGKNGIVDLEIKKVAAYQCDVADDVIAEERHSLRA